MQLAKSIDTNQAVDLFENKYPTQESRRCQAAAQSLVWLLGKEGKEVDPGYVQVAQEKNPLLVDQAIDRDLRKLLAEIQEKGQEKLDAYLLEDSLEGRTLLEWWRVDHLARRDYSVVPMLLVRKLTPQAVDGMIPLHHIAGTCTKWINGRDDRGRFSKPDPESFTHDLMVRLDTLEVRTHEDAGGPVTFLTFATKYHNKDGDHTHTSYDIIRHDDLRLTTGDPKKTNHLPGWNRPVPVPEPAKV